MNEQNTWPDFWESSQNISENPLNTEAIKKLENLWVERKTAIKLAELRWDVGDNEIKNTLEASNTQQDTQKNFSEVRQVLDEHKQNISEQIAAKAMSERIKLWESINGVQNKEHPDTWNVISQSARTFWTFWKDFWVWIIETLKNPKAAMQYTIAKADWVLTDQELNYKIW